MPHTYIAKDRKHLTNDIDLALRGRLLQGLRDVIPLSREYINDIKRLVKDGPFEYRYAQVLCENIFNDIENNESEGSYSVDGALISPYQGGYTIGGAERGECRTLELRLAKSELESPEDIAATIERIPWSGGKFDKQGGRIGICFWESNGELCFDRFIWTNSINRAYELAFRIRDECAFFDLANMVEVINPRAVVASTDGEVTFLRHKIGTTEYRNASAMNKIMLDQLWYTRRTFEGYI